MNEFFSSLSSEFFLGLLIVLLASCILFAPSKDSNTDLKPLNIPMKLAGLQSVAKRAYAYGLCVGLSIGIFIGFWFGYT